MGEHFVFLVDRLLTESTLEAAIESRNQKKPMLLSLGDDTVSDCSSLKDSEIPLTPRKMAECRICQDEDFDSNMETPCSCCGSLKYAHRRCIQRWCNEKGDTICEICHQQFKPGYTAPPPIFRLRGIPMSLRGNWGIARRELNNPNFVAMVSTDRNLTDPIPDEYAISTSRSLMCCRSFALIFMVLLIFRHTLPFLFSQVGDYSFPLIMLLLLRIAGIIVPIYIVLKAVTSFLYRRHQQRVNSSVSTVDEEAGQVPQQ